MKPRRRPREESETGFRHAEPSDKGSPARASANRTMAIGFMERRLVRLVADSSTKTPTVHHTSIPFTFTLSEVEIVRLEIYGIVRYKTNENFSHIRIAVFIRRDSHDPKFSSPSYPRCF
jgi:adenine-specific DNA methylase